MCLNSSFTKVSQNGSRVEPEAVTDLRKRVAGLVEVNHFIYLLRCRRGASEDDALPLQGSTDRHAMTTVLGGELVDRPPCFISFDDLTDLPVRESRLRRALTASLLMPKLAGWFG